MSTTFVTVDHEGLLLQLRQKMTWFRLGRHGHIHSERGTKDILKMQIIFGDRNLIRGKNNLISSSWKAHH